MKTLWAATRRYLTLALGLIALIVASVFVPWKQVIPYLLAASWLDLVILVALSALYYLGRILRYWFTLTALGQRTPLKMVAVACLAAQPVAFLPGGELYRAAMLRRYANVSLKDGTASVFAQALAESTCFALIALVGTILLGQYVVVTSVLTGLLASIWVFIQWYNGRHAHRVANLLPGVNVHHSRMRAYFDRNRTLLGPRNFAGLLGLSLISAAAGSGMIVIASHIVGAGLTWPEGILAFALPSLLEIVSFLPGGFGAHEGGAVALLAFFGVTLAPAVAITLIGRLFTLGIGFIYGFATLGIIKLVRLPRYH